MTTIKDHIRAQMIRAGLLKGTIMPATDAPLPAADAWLDADHLLVDSHEAAKAFANALADDETGVFAWFVSAIGDMSSRATINDFIPLPAFTDEQWVAFNGAWKDETVEEHSSNGDMFVSDAAFDFPEGEMTQRGLFDRVVEILSGAPHNWTRDQVLTFVNANKATFGRHFTAFECAEDYVKWYVLGQRE